MRATARAKIARVITVIGQGGGDGLVERLDHLADDHDRGQGDGEAHDPRGGGIPDRDQPPGGVVRRQDRVDQGAHEGDEGKAAQKGTDDLFQPRRNDIGGIEGYPDDPAAGDGRARAEGEHAERGQKAAAPCGIGDGGIALDEARRDRAPPDIKGDRHADGETKKKQDAERSAASKLLQGIAQDDPQRPQLPRNGLTPHSSRDWG